ncbi:MAG: energy transducer TonB [Candidatus Acidiferrales bacterium]|jgi:TonB family protein
MSRLIRVALCLAATIFTAQMPTWAQTYGPIVKLGTPIDENTMAARRTHFVAPVYSDLARANHIQGSVVMNANIDSQGKVIGLQTISGHPLLVRAALEAAMQWQYEPMVTDGQAVGVDTTITIVFSLSDAQTDAAAPPLSMVPPSAVLIHLQNGRTIHADSSREDGDKIEYTIGEGIYRINKSSVKDIVKGTPGPQPGAASSPEATHTNASSSTVTASALAALPPSPGEDRAIWRMYESTEQLKAECRNGEISKYMHPEFQGMSVFPPSKDEVERECAMFSVEMDPDYERMIDRGVELERNLCSANNMRPLSDLRPELKATPEVQELARIEADFSGRMNGAIKHQPVDRAQGLRMMLDTYRLGGSCGNGG